MKRRSSDWNSDTTDSVFQSKRIMEGPIFDICKAEPPQQQSIVTPPLDMRRAHLSRQHVRALNAQFASWVQTQLQSHPDELWEDGLQDYLAHASNIMEKFNDVVSWLRAKASSNGESFSALGSHAAPNNLVLERKENQIKSFKEETDFARPSTTSVVHPSWGSGALFSTQSPFAFGSQISAPLNNDAPNDVLLERKENQIKSFKDETDSARPSTTSVVNPSWGSGALFSTQSPFAFGSQISAPLNNDASNEADDEELQQPSSPSVKKTEEKGVIVVHEVKCKLYVKSSDPAEKDTWKDKGTGQLSIKCKEGVSKCTRESKPTVLVRNDVGKILLNALLYPGIKTSMQKTSIVAIFHSAPDNGNDGGNSNGVVARTFLIRTKTEEDRNKLAAAIQEYTPAA